jgi:hypothetical protein
MATWLHPPLQPAVFVEDDTPGAGHDSRRCHMGEVGVFVERSIETVQLGQDRGPRS